MSKRDQILAIFKPNAWLGKGDIAKASGVDPGMAGYYLKQLVDDKALVASGTTADRKWALPGIDGAPADSAPPPEATKSPRKGPAKKRGHKKSGKRAKPTKPAVASKLATGNVREFIPAMTADQRMVIIGGTEPLIFSPEQTQSIADLMFGNFEAAA